MNDNSLPIIPEGCAFLKPETSQTPPLGVYSVMTLCHLAPARVVHLISHDSTSQALGM